MAHYRNVELGGSGDQGEMHVGRGAYAGIAPLEDGLFNVAFVTSSKAVIERDGPVDAFFARGLIEIPGVAKRLADATRVGPVRGVGSMANRVRRAAGDGYLLIGDAAGFLDPFTGEGIYEALKAAHLAAPIVHEALTRADTSAEALEPYRRARRRAFAAKRQVSWIVQGFLGRPVLMDYVTERLGQREAVAGTLTGVLGDFRPATAALSPLFLVRLLRP
jgi:flavin-dependent dehydrogenase